MKTERALILLTTEKIYGDFLGKQNFSSLLLSLSHALYSSINLKSAKTFLSPEKIFMYDILIFNNFLGTEELEDKDILEIANKGNFKLQCRKTNK